MAVTYSTTLKNTRLDAVDDAVNAGTGSGYIEIGTTGMAATLVTITLNDPAFNAASGGTLGLDATGLSNTATGTGTAAAARIRTSAAADVITGLSVGTGGADIILDSTSITSGQTVTINSGTITHG